MKLYLARHGETDWNRLNKIQGQTDTPLNEAGRLQARELAEKILQGTYEISAIFCSPQRRARETAQIVGRALGLEVVAMPGLEEMHLGKWEGHSWQEVREQFPDEYQRWYGNRRYLNTPEGESYQELLDRFLPSIQEILGQAAGNVLVVTHSAVIMTFLSYVHQMPFEDMYRNFKMKNAELVEIDTEKLKEDLIY